MKKITYGLLFVSLFLLCGGSAVGWAIANKLAGDEAGRNFLILSIALTSPIYLAQVVLFFMSRTRLLLQIIFISVFGTSLLWFMLSLTLPILWIVEVGHASKMLIASFSVLLFAIKGYEGVREFEEKWEKRRAAIRQHYNADCRTLNWEKFVASFQLSFSLFPPGVPVWMERMLTVLLVLSMIVGLNLRKVYPIFSIFAWGIPCIIASSTLVQIMAVNIMQAVKVMQLEKAMGVKIDALTS
jgi:hypothetical protein